MKIILVFLTFSLVTLSCDEIVLVEDPAYTIKGIVYDSRDKSLLDSVLVIIAQDSAFIHFDSLSYYCSNYCSISENGNFEFSWFGTSSPYPLENMYAIKDGYHVWRFNIDKDRIKRVRIYTDSIYIELEKL